MPAISATRSGPVPLTVVDADVAYRAIASRDARFDGHFVVAVTTTGIYCRPSCPVPIRPKRSNTRFFLTSAAAHDAGFRACKRCAPDASPGSPEWDVRGDLAARAMRLIADGAIERDGVPAVARQLAVTPRHLHRVLVREVGAPPLRLARAHRAATARTLIETTALPFSEVAFAAGFGSIRQFNATIQAIYALTPSELRARAAARRGRGREAPTAERLSVRLATRTPFGRAALWRWLRATAVPGVEDVTDRAYRRTLRLPGGPGVVTLVPEDDHVVADLVLTDLRDLSAAVARCRRILDLDADPVAVEAFLRVDRRLLSLLERRPGIRVPAAADASEALLRAVLGQQVSTAAARAITARVTAVLGARLPAPDGALTHLFPDAEEIAAADPTTFGIPAVRAHALHTAATAVAAGALDLSVGADRGEARAHLLQLPGIGAWTADVVGLRALHDPDILPGGDVALRRAAGDVGITDLRGHGTAWAPWRSYASHLLWDHTLNGAQP